MILCVMAAAPAWAAATDRVPVAILWLGEPATVDDGARIAGDVNEGLRKSPSARPLDSGDDRRALIEGGPATRAAALQVRAEAAFVKLKLAEAARDYEAAEQILLTEVPFQVTQARLGAVERNLLVCYDQLGRGEDAARAAERLTWTAGSNEDVRALLSRHLRSRAWHPQFPPVRVSTEPPGASVYRNLQPLGQSPSPVPGGDPAVDVVDVELPGFRRAHAALVRSGGDLQLALQREDRLGVMVDAARVRAPDVPPAEVTAIGKRVGAARVLAILPDGQKVMARWFDVGTQKWASSSIRVDAAGQPAIERLVGYVAPAGALGPAPAGTVADLPQPKGSRWGAWGKWYTWVAAGAVVALVAGLLIAQNVGEDSLKVSVSK